MKKQVNKVYIYGKHAVEEALLHAPHAINKIFLAPRAAGKHLESLIARSRIPTGPLNVGASKADMLAGTAHQGVIGQVLLTELVVPFEKFIETLQPTADTAVVLLSGVQDPHNVGAIVRSAAGFGASAILIPEHGQSPVTAAVIKVSAGMAFRIPLVSVKSAQDAVKKLKAKGFVTYGLAGEGSAPLQEEAFEAPALFVLGNEGAGLGPDVRRLCDKLVTIPISVRTESLNVAAAAAVALFAWSSKHPTSLS